MGRRYPGWQDNTVENAVQHCAWMCYVTSQLQCTKKQAWKLGEAHENYPGNPPLDKAMDLFNNVEGVHAGGSDLSSCFDICEQMAKDYRLFWWRRVSGGGPRRGLPNDEMSYGDGKPVFRIH